MAIDQADGCFDRKYDVRGSNINHTDFNDISSLALASLTYMYQNVLRNQIKLSVE